MLSLIPSHLNGTSRPTAGASTPSMSLRQRLFGDRSTAFLVLMAVGLVVSVPLSVRQGIEWEPLIRSLVIFLAGPLSTAYDLRVRSIPMLLFVGWLSVLAGVPWPCAMSFGVLAMLLHFLHERAAEQLDVQARMQTRTELASLVRRLAMMKVGNALSLAPAVATAAVRFLIGRGLSVESVLLLVAIGGAVFAYVLYRHVRQFDTSVVGVRRPAAG